MKKIIVIALLLLVIATGIAYAYCQTDYTCVGDCTRQGYMWGYCKKICSWCN